MDVLSIAKNENIHENELIENVSNIPEETLKEIETRTIGQNRNPLGQSAQHFRITSPNFLTTVTRKKENDDKL